MAYGQSSVSAEKLLSISSSIRTFTEQGNENQMELERIRELMRTASTVYFFGFAFYEQNIRVLYDKKPSHLPTVFGTVYKELHAHVDAAKARLKTFANISVTDFVDATCNQFLKDRVLTLPL